MIIISEKEIKLVSKDKKGKPVEIKPEVKVEGGNE